MKEIGSEFWLEKSNFKDMNNSISSLLKIGDAQQLLIAGRTAIDYVLQDIKKPIKTVYMPSYCCTSMLQPFIDRNIHIEFYDVIPQKKGLKYLINYEKDVDIFFATSYFGYNASSMDSIIKNFKQKNIIVIEDITHRLLSGINHCNQADYLIASLRKWFAIPSGGLAIKMKGDFGVKSLVSPSNELINKKVKAMIQKEEYINNVKELNIEKKRLKQNFLGLFSEFNAELQLNYRNVKIDNYSEKILHTINVEKSKMARRQNAEYIYSNLKESEGIRFLFPEPNFKEDCPLFVPIMVRTEIRDNLKKHLISNNIFCPIHWPIPRQIDVSLSKGILYSEELSLICDQRYTITDMKNIITTLGEFTKKL